MLLLTLKDLNTGTFATMTERDSSGAVWDPIDSIWEYVLNDYDQEKEEERAQPKRSKSWNNKRRQKDKALEQEKDQARSQSILDFFTEDSRGDDESPRLNQHQRSRSGNSRRSRSRRGREIEEEEGTIVDSSSWVAFDNDGIEGREPNESTSSSTTTPRRHPWRRNKPSTEETVMDDNSAGSYWDLVMDPLDVNPKTHRNVSSKPLNAGTKKKEASSKNRSNNTGSSRELIARESSFRVAEKKARNQAKEEKQSSKRLGFFKRSFRKQGNTNNDFTRNTVNGSSRSFGSRNQQASGKSKSRNNRLPSKSTSQSQSMANGKDTNNHSPDDFSPFSMLMEVAEKVGSWASDDSDSECSSPSAGSTAENTQQSETTDTDDNSTLADKDTSTITEKTPVPQDNFTEVRLFHQPNHDNDAENAPEERVDENQFENKLYQGYDRSNELPAAIPDSRSSRPSWGRSFVPIRLQRSRGSLASWASHQKVDDFLDETRDHHEGVDTDETTVGDDMNAMRIPENQARDFSHDSFYHAPNQIQQVGESSQVTDASDFHERKGFKRLVCCSVKNKGLDASALLKAQNDMKEVLPRTRMISDENSEQAKLVSTSNENVDAIMGVNTDTFLETKGPQSLYNYDYGKKEHIDVVYEDFSSDPRKSMFTRRYDLDPEKFNSIGDKIVVQIEVSYA